MLAPRITTEIFAILEETFEKVQGIYLDRGTSLFETLAGVTAEEASRPVAAQCASIAAQVFHVRYYLDVLAAYTRQQTPKQVDWAASWTQVTSVSPAEWEDLCRQLHESYQQVRALFEGLSWEGEDDLAGALAIVVHTAYHLGEIRQALGVLRG